MQALILVAESGGPTMLARIGVIRALNRHDVPELNPKGRAALGPAQAQEGSMTVLKRGKAAGWFQPPLRPSRATRNLSVLKSCRCSHSRTPRSE
jgi:hypothetical protein